MAIGTGAAILGSTLLGAGTSALGARGANRAAERNSAIAAQNIDAANTAIGEAGPRAHEARSRGADELINYLRSGTEGYRQDLSPVEDQYNYGVWGMRGMQAPGTPAAWGRLEDASQGDMSQFRASPDYEFRRSEGIRGTKADFNASGSGLYGGNALRGVTDYASNLASGEYGDWWNRQYGLGGAQRDVSTGDYDRDYRNYQGLTDIGLNALYGRAGAARDLETNIGQTYGNLYGSQAQDITNAGYGVAGNLVGNAQIQANTPYVSPWGGVSNALQGGVENWLYNKKRQPVMTGPPGKGG